MLTSQYPSLGAGFMAFMGFALALGQLQGRLGSAPNSGEFKPNSLVSLSPQTMQQTWLLKVLARRGRRIESMV